MLCFCFQGCDSQMSMSEMSCSESTSSCQSLAHGSAPEILIGLLYNATTGRLAAEVIKGSHFKNLAANRPPSEWNIFFILILIHLGGFQWWGLQSYHLVLPSHTEIVQSSANLFHVLYFQSVGKWQKSKIQILVVI